MNEKKRTNTSFPKLLNNAEIIAEEGNKRLFFLIPSNNLKRFLQLPLHL